MTDEVHELSAVVEVDQMLAGVQYGVVELLSVVEVALQTLSAVDDETQS